MKKIISIIAAVCMILSVCTIFASAADPSRCATIYAANESGYGIWDYDNNQIIVHIANETVWDNIINRRTFTGFVVASTSNDWSGTGIRKDPDAGDGQGCAQYAGSIVETSIDAASRTFAFTMPQNIKDAVDGVNTDTGSNFKTMVEKYGGYYAVRIDATDANAQYIGYCLPCYDEKPDGLRFTEAVMQDNGQIVLKFNSEVDNVYDPEMTNGREGTIYYGVSRETYLCIVDNTTDWNIMSVGGTEAKWPRTWLSDAWNWPQGYITMACEYEGILGCNSYADVCALVDEGGALEGCVVAYAFVEYTNPAASNNNATYGDGYINSIFANGKYGDINYVLKANKKAVAGQPDAAFVAMYTGYNAQTADTTSVAVAGSILVVAAAAVVLSKRKHA